MAFSIRSSLASATRGGLEKPGAPSNIVPTWNAVAAATSTATITFSAGSPTGINYTVSATPSQGSATLQIEAVTSGTLISLLVNNTNYTFTVTAKRGTLTNSATSEASLSPVGPVTIGTISSVTNSGASVAYTAPTGGGTYAITTTPTSSSTAATSTPTTISGLTGNTNYTFTITILNARGSNSSTSGSYLTIPDQPSIGTVTKTNATTVSVPYTLATGNTGTGKGTINSVTIVSYPNITLTYTNTSATPVSVTGTFASGQGYTFTISVTNNTGTSAVSLASNSVTPNPVIAPIYPVALAYINFDQSTTLTSNTEQVTGNAIGSSPTSYTGTTSISVSTSVYKSYANSIYFPGGQSFTTSFTLPSTSSGLAFSFWFYVTNNVASNNPRVFQSSLGDGASVYYGSGSFSLNQGLGSFALNTWYHLAYSCSITNNTQQYYLDAVAKGSGTNPGYAVSTGHNISLGNKSGGTGDSFIGNYDDIQIFNNPLTASQVTFIKNNPGLQIKNGFLWSVYYNYFGASGFMDSGLVGTAGSGATILTLAPINTAWGSNSNAAIAQNRGYTTDMTSLSTGTSGIIVQDGAKHQFSVEWLGYFCPNATGNWIFSTDSDDASYLWIDNDTNTYATTGYLPSNSNVNNGSDHGMQVRTSGNIALTKDKYYLLRIQFGEAGGGYNMRVTNTPPGGTATYNFSGLVFPFLG